MRIEPFRFGHGTKPAAAHLAYPRSGEPPPRQRIEIGEPLARYLPRSKAGSRTGILSSKCLKNLVADFECLRPDGWPQPGHQRIVASGQFPKCGNGLFDHAGSESAPSRMRRTDALPRAVGKQHGEAIGSEDRQHAPRYVCDRRIRARFGTRRTRAHRFRGTMHGHAVNLVEPARFLGEQRGKPAPILNDRVRIVTAPRPEIQAPWPPACDSPCTLTNPTGAQGHARAHGIGKRPASFEHGKHHTAPGSLNDWVAPSMASSKSISAAWSKARQSFGQSDVQTRLRPSCG